MKHSRHAALACVLAAVLLLSTVFCALPGFADDVDPASCPHDFSNAEPVWGGTAAPSPDYPEAIDEYKPETITLSLTCPLCGAIYTKEFVWETDIDAEDYWIGGQETCEDGNAKWFMFFCGQFKLSTESGDPIDKTFTLTGDNHAYFYFEDTANTHFYDTTNPYSLVCVWSEDGRAVENVGYGCMKNLSTPDGESGNNGQCRHVEEYLDPDEYQVEITTIRFIQPTCTSVGVDILIPSITYQGENIIQNEWTYEEEEIPDLIQSVYDENGDLLPFEEWDMLKYYPWRHAVEVPMLEHIPDGEWQEAEPATCTDSGRRYQLCENGDHIAIEETIPPKGHTPVPVQGKSATCTESGLTDGSKCSVCGETLTQQKTIPPTGHKASAWKIVQEPTQTEAGLRQKTCTVCGEVLEQEEIEPLGEVCTCACHEDTLFTRLIRYLFTLLSKVFGIDIKCCEDMVPYDGNIASLT